MSKQRDLFSHGPSEPLYPHSPGYVRDSDTSEAAAMSINSETMQYKALAIVKQAGGKGKTCSEIEILSGWSHQSASARLRELVLLGKIYDSGRRRPGASGRMQRIYLPVSGAPDQGAVNVSPER